MGALVATPPHTHIHTFWHLRDPTLFVISECSHLGGADHRDGRDVHIPGAARSFALQRRTRHPPAASTAAVLGSCCKQRLLAHSCWRWPQNEGAAYIVTVFNMLVFRPFIDEIMVRTPAAALPSPYPACRPLHSGLFSPPPPQPSPPQVGEVLECRPDGIRVSIKFFHEIFVPGAHSKPTLHGRPPTQHTPRATCSLPISRTNRPATSTRVEAWRLSQELPLQCTTCLRRTTLRRTTRTRRKISGPPPHHPPAPPRPSAEAPCLAASGSGSGTGTRWTSPWCAPPSTAGCRQLSDRLLLPAAAHVPRNSKSGHQLIQNT